jgi:hypothetical protein
VGSNYFSNPNHRIKTISQMVEAKSIFQEM